MIGIGGDRIDVPRGIQIVAAIVLWSAAGLPTSNIGEAGEPAATILQADDVRSWWRGNLHTHTHWSDGDDYPEMVVDWYLRHGYQFLALTDHNVLAEGDRWVDINETKGGRKGFERLQKRFPDWVEIRQENDHEQVRLRRFDELAEKFNSPEEFLLIQGEEITDHFQRRSVHVNAINLQEAILPRRGENFVETIQNNVDAVNAQQALSGRPMMVVLNHPNYRYSTTAEVLARIEDLQFFEIYNGGRNVNNAGDADRPSTERLWDIVLSQRLGQLKLPVMFGLAVDDSHGYQKDHDQSAAPGRGWVMVLAPKLTPEALISAMKAGEFYASSGVQLSRIASSESELEVIVDSEGDETYTIEFIGTRSSVPLEGSTPPPVKPTPNELSFPLTLHYDKRVGEQLAVVQGTHARYDFHGDEIYVRVVVTSSRPHPNPARLGDHQQAWTQPTIGPAALKYSEPASH